jgi:hypothetical protein
LRARGFGAGFSTAGVFEARGFAAGFGCSGVSGFFAARGLGAAGVDFGVGRFFSGTMTNLQNLWLFGVTRARMWHPRQADHIIITPVESADQ